MSKLECTIKLNEENQNIIVSGINENDIFIDYNGDIDFTELISKLTRCIDTDKEIDYTLPDTPDDEKLKLIIETIEDILLKYNQALTEETNSSDHPMDEGDESNADTNLPF